MQLRHIAHLASVAGLVIAATSCKKEAPPPPPPPPAPNVVVINTADFRFSAPDTVPSGWTMLRLVNAGPSLHHAQILKLTDGKTIDTLMAALRMPPRPGAPPPPWIHEIGSPNAPAPGSVDTAVVITNLEPGHYAIVCFIPDSHGRPHVALGMSRALEVIPASGPAAAEPTADVEIKLADYAFTESGPIASGRHTLKITNDGPQTHEFFLARLDSGVTAAQFIGWVEHGMAGRPPARPFGGTVGIANGGHAYVVANLAPGNYALICFLPDAKDGKEHYKHGMIKQITVT